MFLILCDISAEFRLNYKCIIIKITMYSSCAITSFKHLQFIFKNIWNKMNMKWNIVCIGVSTPPLPQKHHPSLSCQAPLNLQIVKPPFLDNPSLYIGFSWTPSPSKSDFSVNPKNIKVFFIFNCILCFKSNLIFS